MNVPNELKYTKEHIWLNIEGDEITVGITHFAQNQMGDILFVDLPGEGDSFSAGETFSEVESSKTTQELTLPFDFEVIASNEELDDSPEAINEDAYGSWIVKIKAEELTGLIEAAEYETLCAEE